MSGVLLNVLTVLVGTAAGLAFGSVISERFRAIAFTAIGLSTGVIGASMAIGGLGRMGDTGLGDYAALVFIGSLIAGALIGEALRIEYWLERFGRWLQDVAYRLPFLSTAPKTSADEPGEKGHTLVEGFVTASLLFCVGAMTFLGSIQDGLGEHNLLYIKATLDGFAALFLASTLGVGVGLSVIPILAIQGSLSLGAQALERYMTPGVITSITAVGGALILAIGLDLLGIKRLPVGNMMPSIIIAAIAGWIFG
ncbi:MAG TPA: DUF554 domain-containing protein [Coriobacteriia bacterium]|nr:DUF554 domain-containing protein [Coriobacteriia bacterium]